MVFLTIYLGFGEEKWAKRGKRKFSEGKRTSNTQSTNSSYCLVCNILAFHDAEVLVVFFSKPIYLITVKFLKHLNNRFVNLCIFYNLQSKQKAEINQPTDFSAKVFKLSLLKNPEAQNLHKMQ